MEEHPTGPRYLPSCVYEYGAVVACVYKCMVHCIMHLHNLTLFLSFGGQDLWACMRAECIECNRQIYIADILMRKCRQIYTGPDVI